MQRYWLRSAIQGWKEVSQIEFAKAEREAGFFPKPGCGPLATAGFSSNHIEGKVTYEEEKEAKKMQLKDLNPGEMFRRPTGAYRYIKGNERKEGHNRSCADYFCYNLDGPSTGYFMPGHMEVVRISPTTESTPVREEPFYMCYVQGAGSPTKKHTGIEARNEAERLARYTRKKVYVLKAVGCVTYTPPTSSGLTWTKLEKGD